VKPSSRARVLTDQDVHLFHEGTHLRLFDQFGAHAQMRNGEEGVSFLTWAPNATRVSVIGNFNQWSQSHPLSKDDRSGAWETFIPGIRNGEKYKYAIETASGGLHDKTDPFAFYCEGAPGNASITWNLDYEWGDQHWMGTRSDSNSLSYPISIYEVHIGSWRRRNGNWLGYREFAVQLIPYLKEMGFTHVEFLPIMEHPFYGSWGYQTSGYFAPTSRYGTPQDLMWLIDQLHQNGIGVLLDWVPSHFPKDPHGLAWFDGTNLYEYADPRMRVNQEWDSFVFDYTRGEVQSFLLSSAFFWLEKYHADGIRVDAVASMLYRDYARKAGEWTVNELGGRENLEAISFLQALNRAIREYFPDVLTVAEESTAWPDVTGETRNGLRFHLKWDMGWRHDTLEYLAQDPFFRKLHHNKLTFRNAYAFSERYVLPISHDDVARGHGSLISRIPGDPWQKFATLRLLLAYMYTQPGKKLLFMGTEFGQPWEWDHDGTLDWQASGGEPHKRLRLLTGQLNFVYRSERALWAREFERATFDWIDCCDAERNILSFLRKDSDSGETIMVVCNFSPVPRANYRLGVPAAGLWREILNTDATQYGGAGHGNFGGVEATPIPLHGRPYSVTILVPPLASVLFRSPSA
jgi:1,4-alpha-glucan branching enzyme